VDPQRMTAFGANPADVNATLATAWGGRYVNDFVDQGRVKRVYVQGDTPYRSSPEALGQWYVRTTGGQMAPFSAFSKLGWSVAPTSVSRFNGVPAFEVQGQAAPGVSSGDAMNAIEEIAARQPGTGVAWSGTSYEERLSAGRAPLLYALSLAVVFLCLAALYESWSIPLSVILVVPLGVLGVLVGVTLRDMPNDVYFKVGLITVIGLSAKNAILIIEFAKDLVAQGKGVIEATLEAAHLRFRPILMTSMAFMLGVLPLAISTGAGSASQRAIGTGVIGGMITATVLAVLMVPVFFVVVRRFFKGSERQRRMYAHELDKTDTPPAGTAAAEGKQ